MNAEKVCSRESNRYEAILEAAAESFFKKGFEGTSIRSIMKQTGAEAGLFYYYFADKSDVFDKVIERFFEKYHRDLKKQLLQAERDPFRALPRIFYYLSAKTVDFRGKYAAVMHGSMLMSLKEQALCLLEPYIRQILVIMKNIGVKPPVTLDAAAQMLAHGAGSLAMSYQGPLTAQEELDLRTAINLVLGLGNEFADLNSPLPAQRSDADDIVRLIHDNSQFFPAAVIRQLERNVFQRIAEREIIVIYSGDAIAGCLVFSRKQKSIDFLAVLPQFRRRDIAKKLIVTAMAQFPVGTVLSVTVCRCGEDQLAGASRLCKIFSFSESAELSACGYPYLKLTASIPGDISFVFREKSSDD